MGRNRLLKQTAYLLVVYIVIAWVFVGSIVTYAYTGNGNLIVHVTNTGSCYHKSGCGSLRSDIEMTLEDAYIAGYLRCDRCKPPIYTGEAERYSVKEKSTGGSSGGSSKEKNTKPLTKSIETVPRKTFNIKPVLYTFGCIMVAFIAVNKIKEDIKREKERIHQRQEYEARKKFYEENHKGKSIQEIVGAPSGVTINKDGSVISGSETEEKPYGELTVFVSRSGIRYHTNRHCNGAYIKYPVNKYAALSKGYTACRICGGNPESIPEWYTKIPPVIKSLEEFEDHDEIQA